MTGPHLLAAVAYDEYYGDTKKMMADFGKLLGQNFRRLAGAGCKHIQLEDLGAWIPHLSGTRDYDWVCEIVDHTLGTTPPGVERAWPTLVSSFL